MSINISFRVREKRTTDGDVLLHFEKLSLVRYDFLSNAPTIMRHFPI